MLEENSCNPISKTLSSFNSLKNEHQKPLLRSRGTRERILIWFRRREKSRFFGLQIGRPCRFLQGLWASFSCPSVTSCLLSLVASFVVFDILGVSLKLTGF